MGGRSIEGNTRKEREDETTLLHTDILLSFILEWCEGRYTPIDKILRIHLYAERIDVRMIRITEKAAVLAGMFVKKDSKYITHTSLIVIRHNPTTRRSTASRTPTLSDARCGRMSGDR